MKDAQAGTLHERVATQLSAVEGLLGNLKQMHLYLIDVVNGEIAIDNKIIYQLQDVFNLLPNLQIKQIIDAFTSSTNDELHVIFLASLVCDCLYKYINI